MAKNESNPSSASKPAELAVVTMSLSPHAIKEQEMDY